MYGIKNWLHFSMCACPNAPDLFRLPKLEAQAPVSIGVGDRPGSIQGAVSFGLCAYGGFAK